MTGSNVTPPLFSLALRSRASPSPPTSRRRCAAQHALRAPLVVFAAEPILSCTAVRRTVGQTLPRPTLPHSRVRAHGHERRRCAALTAKGFDQQHAILDPCHPHNRHALTTPRGVQHAGAIHDTASVSLDPSAAQTTASRLAQLQSVHGDPAMAAYQRMYGAAAGDEDEQRVDSYRPSSGGKISTYHVNPSFVNDEEYEDDDATVRPRTCLLYTSPSPRD